MTNSPAPDRRLSPIWQWYPDSLTHSSSVWWFFLLFPEQDGAYGPQQVMLTLVSPVGKGTVQVNRVPHHGLRPAPVDEPFPAYTLAWIYDGQQMYDRLANHPGTGQVIPGESIRTWTPEGYGSEIVAGDGRPFAVDARFRGELGGGVFQAWGSPDSEITAPHEVRRDTPLGGADMVAWRRLQFAGEFTTPRGTENWSGFGYFQRICLDIVPFPWKWMWTVFADGSVFSCFVPYLGLQLFRRGDWFFPGWLENLTYPIQPSAYFWDAGTGQHFTFKQKVRVGPQFNSHAYPHFAVYCEAENGDYLVYRALSYAHNQVLMERPQLGGRWHSLYNYNEYLFRVADLTGRLDGRPLDVARYGQGHGNCEYSWGLGF